MRIKGFEFFPITLAKTPKTIKASGDTSVPEFVKIMKKAGGMAMLEVEIKTPRGKLLPDKKDTIEFWIKMKEIDDE